MGGSNPLQNKELGKVNQAQLSMARTILAELPSEAKATMFPEKKKGKRNDIQATSSKIDEVIGEYIRMARRHMTTGQKATAVAKMLPDVAKLKRKDSGYPDIGRSGETSKKTNKNLLSMARTILAELPGEAKAVAKMFPEASKGGRGKNCLLSKQFTDVDRGLLSMARPHDFRPAGHGRGDDVPKPRKGRVRETSVRKR